MADGVFYANVYLADVIRAQARAETAEARVRELEELGESVYWTAEHHPDCTEDECVCGLEKAQAAWRKVVKPRWRKAVTP